MTSILKRRRDWKMERRPFEDVTRRQLSSQGEARRRKPNPLTPGLLASRAVRILFSVFKPPHLWYLVMAALATYYSFLFPSPATVFHTGPSAWKTRPPGHPDHRPHGYLFDSSVQHKCQVVSSTRPFQIITDTPQLTCDYTEA